MTIPSTREMLRWFSAELIGTALLATVVGVITQVGVGGIEGFAYENLFAPALVAITVGVCIYLFGGVSGAHFNPAVTIPLYVFRKVGAVQMGVHLVAQILGALLGFQGITRILSAPYYASTALPAFSWSVAGAEMIGAFVLVLAVAHVVFKRVEGAWAGLVIGSALFVGICLSLGASGAVLNPALVIGMGSFNFTYLIAPILGGLLAVAVTDLFAVSERE